jgi:hypothetical protein
LWWATFVTDVWSSVCHGNPSHIYPGSFTTSPLAMDDLTLDEDVPASLRHMVEVSVSRIMHTLLLSSLFVLFLVLDYLIFFVIALTSRVLVLRT